MSRCRHALPALALLTAGMTGCVAPTPPPPAHSFRGADPGTAERLSRRFEADSAAALLAAITDALQDLGYMVISAEPSLGVVVATRNGAISRSLLGLPMTTRHVDRVSIAIRAVAPKPAKIWRMQTSWHRAFPERPEDVRRGFTLQDDAAIEELFAAVRRHLARPVSAS